MKKVVVFPYHPDIRTLIDHRNFLLDYQLHGFMSYKEDWKLIELLNTAAGLSEKPHDQLLDECDAIIILDNYRDYDSGKYYQVIRDANEKKKEILITPLAESQLDLADYRDMYRMLELQPEGVEFRAESFEREKYVKLHEIDIPIIGIVGQGKHCDKFENQLLMKEVLEPGYRTAVISSNALGALFGCYTMPAFMYEWRPFEEKIVLFNDYAWQLLKSHELDVLVIGIPEGIVPFEKYESHHFAEYPLIISTAVSIDMAVFCTYFMSDFDFGAAIKSIGSYCTDKFGIPVGAMAVSRTSFEIPQEELKNIIFEHLYEPYLEKHYPDLKYDDFPLIDMTDRAKAYDAIRASIRPIKENAIVV